MQTCLSSGQAQPAPAPRSGVRLVHRCRLAAKTRSSNASRGLAASAIVLAVSQLVGCEPAEQPAFPTEETLTPGIFLEPAERAVLPPGVQLREVYPKGLELTRAAEGFRRQLYNDAGKHCSIGYGHLVKLDSCDGSEPREFRRGIAEPTGTQMLVTDMERARVTVTLATSAHLTDGQYAALCDFVYNVGSANFRNSKLLTLVNQRQFERVPEQLRRWVVANGREVRGLQARREREIELFFDGVPIPRAAPLAGEDLSPIDIRAGQ